jgi:hypothetical protein
MNKGLKVDLSGQRFDKRVVLSLHSHVGSRPLWNVKCDCGREFTCLSQDLKRGGPCRNCSPGLKAIRPYRRKRPYEALYNGWKNRLDKLDNHRVFISYEEFLTFTTVHECHYCGARILWAKFRQRGKDYSSATNLDRKDSALPYTMDNVVVCCKRCNIGKNTHFTYKEWKQLGDVIRTWREDAVQK